MHESIHVKNADVQTSGGITRISGKAFSGDLFLLFESSDTQYIRSYENGKPHGPWTEWYEAGKIREQRFFNRGQKVGIHRAWWPNGENKWEYAFENGVNQGRHTTWNSEGQLISEMNYDEGQEEGRQVVFYDNGSIKSNYVIKNGRRYGLLGTKNCINVRDSVK